MYILIYLLVTAIKREGSDNDKMIIESLEQSSLFILTLIILLIILVKNYYYQDNIDDDVKIRRYFSEDIESSNKNHNNNNNSIFAKILDLFKWNSANGDDGGRLSFTHSVEKFYGRVFPSSFWTTAGDDDGKDYNEPLLDSAKTSNDLLDASKIASLQTEIVSNGKEMSQTLMKHLIDSKTKNVLDVAPKNNKSISQGNDRNVDDDDNYLIVSVIKWGFRKRYLSSDGNNGNKDNDTEGDISTVQSEALNDKDKSNLLKSPTNHSHSDEVEFEITLKLRDKVADSPEQQWYSQKEIIRVSLVMRKTAYDIFTFHLEIVSSFGDLAPRKPRLRTTFGGGGGSANRHDRHEIISDTRTIATYLSAILRIDQPTATLAFFDFLEMPPHLKAVMTPNLFTNLNPTTNGISLIDDNSYNNPPLPPITNISRNEQLFSVVESTVLNNKQDKYRKLFVAMRVHLKPKEIAIRCRLFHGVITGADICKWLLRYGAGDDSLSNSVKDRIEANRIGQELLSCGLLSCVTYGFPDDFDEEEIQTFNEEVGMNKFCDLPSHIYTFPVKGSNSSIVGKFTLFGEALAISIPQWSRSEENDDKVSSNRETQTYNVRQSEIMNISGGSGTLGHIEYLVVVSHLYDEWFGYKRFREFEQLKNALAREGIKTEVPLPTKSFGVFATQIDSRKNDLELFLQNISDVVIKSCNERANIILAKFLDPNFDDLNLVQKSNIILNTP